MFSRLSRCGVRLIGTSTSSRISTILHNHPGASALAFHHAKYHQLPLGPVTPSPVQGLPLPVIGTYSVKSRQSSIRPDNLSILQPATIDKEYILPSLIKSNSSVSILDPCSKSNIELPTLIQHKLEIFVPSIDSVQKIIEDPPLRQNSIGGVIIEKHAKNVLKNRRRHMNRHKLKKLRKRMKFVYIKLAQRKTKRREKLLQKMQDDIVQAAEVWDPKEQAKEMLDRARRGGFRIDIFASRGNDSQRQP